MLKTTRPSASADGNFVFPGRQPGPTKAKLSRKAVDEALRGWAKGKRLRVWFQEPQGLFLSVTANGAASYYLRFRRTDGTTSEIALGSEALLTPALAGEKARQMIAQQTLQGVDPAGARREAKTQARASRANTFRLLAEAFMDAAENQGIAPRTLECRRGLLDLHILPRIGDRPAGELKRADIRECVRAIQKAIREGNPDDPKAGNRRANQAKSFISQIYSWGIDEGRIESNPAQFKKIFEDDPVKRIGRMTEERMRLFWTNLVAEETDKHRSEGRAISIAIRLAMVTLQRPNEVCNAHMSDFDWQGKLWRIPEDRTKTNTVYEVPLSDLAVSLFREAFKLSGSKWAFPGKAHKESEDPVRPCVTSKHWHRLRARLLKDKSLTDADVQLYDCKRFGRTRLTQALGFPPHIAERVINHANPRGMSAVYDVADYGPEVRRAQEAWSAELLRIVTNEPRPENVVSLRQAAE